MHAPESGNISNAWWITDSSEVAMNTFKKPLIRGGSYDLQLRMYQRDDVLLKNEQKSYSAKACSFIKTVFFFLETSYILRNWLLEYSVS